ncbi:hypothetical protein FACS189443_7190 [Planctomycetales bacterium]|nr:hypothetical protein FACS189443_7190 [Planctomycetales bacterium]
MNEVDRLLSGRENVTLSDIRKTLENRGVFCDSFLFNVRNIGGLQATLNESDEQLYAITALPNSINSDRHFVAIVQCSGTHLMVFDVSNNRTGMIDIANYKGHQIALPVLFASRRSIHYQAVSRYDILILILSAGILASIIIPLYFFFPISQIKQVGFNGISYLRQYFTCRSSIIVCVVLAVAVVLCLLYREYLFTIYPLTFKQQYIDLGEVELFTKNETNFDIVNRSFQSISIEDIQVSCSCLKIVDYPTMIEPRKSQKVKLELTPLLEGNMLYQTLIVPKDAASVIGKISYKGYQHVRILPKYHNVGMVALGEQKIVTCEFSLKDLRENSFSITAVNLQGDLPIFETSGDLPSQIKKSDRFRLTFKHLGNAPKGNFLQSFEIKGKRDDTGEEIVLLGNIVGIVF